MTYYRQGIDPSWVKDQLGGAMDRQDVWQEVLSAIADGRCENVRECAKLALQASS